MSVTRYRWTVTGMQPCDDDHGAMRYVRETDFEALQIRLRDALSFPGCRSARDGECNWEFCPQLADGEPEKSGRHCPLDADLTIDR